jgi:anti-sigma-K factor RskA
MEARIAKEENFQNAIQIYRNQKKISPCSPLFSVSSVLSLCLSVERKNLPQSTQRKAESTENLLIYRQDDESRGVAIAIRCTMATVLCWPCGLIPVINQNSKMIWFGCGVQI